MNTQTLRYLLLILFCACTPLPAQCQSSAPELLVSAEGQLLTATNNTLIFLTIHLVNSSDHDVTVLTKNLSLELDGSATQMNFTVGYSNPAITHDGHPIVPSLYDFSPVTLKPNEEAFVSKEISGMPNLKQITPETKFVVRYTISPNWAKRFSLWSGAAESKPFNARLRKSR